MAQLKAQLEAAGYDTTGFDEADLLTKLDAAGFDTSSLGGAPQTGLDKAVDVSKKVTGAVDTLFKPVGAAIGAIHSGSEALSNKLAESGHPLLAMQAAGPSVAIEGVGKGMELLDKAGEKVAEFGGRRGFPKTGAAIGTAISMAPDIAAGAGAIAKRQLIAQGLKGAARTATSPLRLAKDLVTKPSAAEARMASTEAIAAAKEGGETAIKNLAEKGREKLSLARSTREEAKKGLIEAEEKAGLHFESTPGFEKLIADKKKMAEFTQKIGRLAKRTPEELAQSVPSEQLQLFRKVAQEGEKVSGLSDIANSQLRHGKDVFTRALGLKEKGVGKALERFREADVVTKEIPGETSRSLRARKEFNQKNLDDLRLKGAKDVLEARKLDRKRKVVKGLAKGVAGYLAAKSIFK